MALRFNKPLSPLLLEILGGLVGERRSFYHVANEIFTIPGGEVFVLENRLDEMYVLISEVLNNVR